MKSRTSNLRLKIVCLLLSLAALWAFAAFVTVRDGLNLLWIRTLDQQVGRPTDALVRHLQEERRQSAVALANPGSLFSLDEARRRTDEATRNFKTSSGTPNARWAATPQARQRVSELTALMDTLNVTREQIDRRAIDRVPAIDAYTARIDASYRVFGAISYFNDRRIDADLSHLLILSRGRELLSQEDALVSGAFASGFFTAREAARFAEMVGAQRFVRGIGVAGLPADAHIHGPVVNGPTLSWLRTVEDLLVAAAPGAAPPVGADTWRNAADNALNALADLDIDLAEAAIGRATGPATMILVRLVAAAGLGLVALIASIVLSITTARAIVRRLRRLRDTAQDLANVRLPSVVDRLSRGEEVDVGAPVAGEFGEDEIAQLGRAFDAAHETAVRVAVEQAQLRRGVRDMFVSMARRNQTLVQRQLRLLDGMEARTTDQSELDDLFRVDQLATRMRRNAENLLVLAGSASGRGWRRLVPVVDAVRAAVAEVEEYQRVRLWHLDPGELGGLAVGDVVHLLAELIENGLTFSPPQSEVRVGGVTISGGYLLEIEDDGLGMSVAELAEANELLGNPPEFKLTGNARLGLFVVARLAARHGVRVRLQRSPRAGTTARVLVPASLMTGHAVPDPALNDDWEPAHHKQPMVTTTAGNAVGTAVVVAARTPAGLPVRRRKGAADPAPVPASPKPAEIDPADVDVQRSRRLMEAYQRGTRLGRVEAEKHERHTLERNGDAREDNGHR